MAKVGFEKNTAKKFVEKRQVKHKYVDAPVFEVEDATQKLIHIIGGGFFNEPRYYSTNSKGDVVTGQDNLLNGSGMTEQAQEVLETAKAVLEGETPEDLLIIANWVRTDLKIRTTPQILLALAATSEKTKPYLRKYVPAVIQRADEIRQVFAAYNALFNSREDGKRDKGLPHSLAKALRDAFLRFKEASFLKYDTSDRPTFGDVALMIKERKRLPKPLFDYLANHTIVDAEATPVFAAKAQLNLKKVFDPEAKVLAKKSKATWENLISQFGSKKEIWEYLIETGLIKYMATLRNLRNFEKVDISEEHWDKVYKTLTTEMGHKQLPFRFMAARKHVTCASAISAVDVALDNAVSNVPELPGKTFVMSDASGSMSSTISDKSEMTCMEVGYALSAIMAKKGGRKTKIGVFGASFKEVSFSEADSVMSIIHKMEKDGSEVGHSTNAYLAMYWLLGRVPEVNRDYWGTVGMLSKCPDKPTKVDRIVVISDMVCYGMDNLGALMEEYRRTVNPDVKYYSINMQGNGQSQADPKDKNTLLISGWSESIFTVMREFEELIDETGKQVPSINLLRERFKVE